MDIVSLLRFVIEHNDKIIGSLVALFIATAILLLWRSISDKGEESSGSSGVDLSSIEGAMRKVLASQPVSVTAVPGGVSVAPAEGAGADEAQMAAMREAIAEREAKIAELQKALEEAKLLTASAEAAGEGGGGADPAQLAELKTKVEELQARLAEYEIIEDDIADLSLYKEENGRLKNEIEDLKKQLEAAQSSVPAAAAAPAPATKIAVEGEAALKFEKAEKFELDPNDDIMKQFAEAVDEKKVEPPLAAFNLPQEEIDAMVRETMGATEPAVPEAATASTPEEAAVDDAQAKIDAMFAAANAAPASTPESEIVAPAEAAPVADPQAEIDRMLAQAAAEVESIDPATPTDPGTILVSSEEADAEIDRMLAAAAADAGTSDMTPFENPQAMADALLAGDDPAKDGSKDSVKDSGPNSGSNSGQEEDSFASLLATDTEKMLSEVETLGNSSVQDEGDALTEALDTEKLLAEVDSLGDGGEKEPEEDLLAEFKDAAKGGR